MNKENPYTKQNDYAVRMTQRGFRVCNFLDAAGNKCSIQESSSAEESAIWLGVDATADGTEVTSRMHLNYDAGDEALTFLEQFVGYQHGVTKNAPSAVFTDFYDNYCAATIGDVDGQTMATVGVTTWSAQLREKATPVSMLVDKPLAEALIKFLHYFCGDGKLPDDVDAISQEDLIESVVTSQTEPGSAKVNSRATELAIAIKAKEIHNDLIELELDNEQAIREGSNALRPAMANGKYNTTREIIIQHLLKLAEKLGG